MVEILFNALNQNLVQFELKPGVEVVVYVTQLTLGECGVRGAAVLLLMLQKTPGESVHITALTVVALGCVPIETSWQKQEVLKPTHQRHLHAPVCTSIKSTL